MGSACLLFDCYRLGAASCKVICDWLELVFSIPIVSSCDDLTSFGKLCFLLLSEGRFVGCVGVDCLGVLAWG